MFSSRVERVWINKQSIWLEGEKQAFFHTEVRAEERRYAKGTQGLRECWGRDHRQQKSRHRNRLLLHPCLCFHSPSLRPQANYQAKRAIWESNLEKQFKERNEIQQKCCLPSPLYCTISPTVVLLATRKVQTMFAGQSNASCSEDRKKNKLQRLHPSCRRNHE